MDRNTMKNTIKSLKLWVLGCVMLFAGVQSASAALKGCEGTVYLKLPEGWTTAFTAGGGNFNPFTKSTTYPGWYEISTAQIGGTNSPDAFHISVARNDYGQAGAITRTQIGKNLQFQETNGFTCKDFGTKNELWIQPSFEDPTKPYVEGEPPDVKYFYVFLPDDKIWKSANPMISEDGVERELSIDNDNCGWYYRRYVNVKELPTKVFIRRDDDEDMKEAIGMGGQKAASAGKAPEEINLKMMFEVYETELGSEKNLYFVADEKKAAEIKGFDFGWYLKRPAIEGKCSYNLAAVIYDTDASLHPAFSCYSEGGEGCQGKEQPNDGVHAAQNVLLTTALAAIDSCIGIRSGLVQDTLIEDLVTHEKKPKLTAAGKKCFIDDKYFDQLFTYTPGVNEKSCYDMPFKRADDGKWEFNSDDYISNGLKVKIPGGFYPVEDSDDDKIKATDPNQIPVPAARKKRWAQGPAYYGAKLRAIDPKEGMPVLDVYCNGPGWSGGHNCEGHFGDGGDTEKRIRADLKLLDGDQVIGWDDVNNAPAGWPVFSSGENLAGFALTAKSTRWDSKEGDPDGNGGRNQHFCFESHANFIFKKGLKFNFRGDDDIWVFINNKLAVDLGGTHLAAPGYVDLDKFLPNAKVGHSYDIDIFFCDRRTTMSNVRIKTNMFLDQNNGIVPEGMNNVDEWLLTGDNEYKICYTKTGNGDCAGGSSSKTQCGEEIQDTIYYMFTTDPTGNDPSKTLISEEQFAQNKIQMNGIIDVSRQGYPKVNDVKLMNSGLAPGDYYLRIRIGKDKQNLSWTIKGNVGIVTRNAVMTDNNGNVLAQLPFQKEAMASMPSATTAEMIPLYIGSIVDQCNDDAS